MSNGCVRIGLIGCGGIAATHLSTYQKNPRANVVAVCDVDQAKADATAANADANAYTDFKRMLEAEQLDGVSLLTPPAYHEDIAIDTLRAGVHVFCEKPLSNSLASGRRMAAAAAETDKLLLVAQCHRFHEPVRRTHELIAEGKLGQISTFRNRFGYRDGAPNDRTRVRGGIWLDNGGHSVYLFRFLVGEVRSIVGWCPQAERQKIEDLCNCAMLLESVDGAGGVIELNGLAGKCLNVIEVYGTDGTAVVNYGGPSQFLPASGDPVPLDDPSLPGSHRFDREIEQFIRCVLGEEEPTIGAEEGVKDLAILEAGFRSIQTGRCETVAG